MYVYINVYMYLYGCIHIHINVHIHACECMFICINFAPLYICIKICVYVFMYVSIYVYKCMHAHINFAPLCLRTSRRLLVDILKHQLTIESKSLYIANSVLKQMFDFLPQNLQAATGTYSQTSAHD